MIMTYAERMTHKTGCILENVLLNDGHINMWLLNRWKETGVTGIHILSFPDLTVETTEAYVKMIGSLETGLDLWGIRIASLRVSVYSDGRTEAANEAVKNHLHSFLRWPQRFLSVVYAWPHYHTNRAYMCALNSLVTLYDEGDEAKREHLGSECITVEWN